MSQRGMSSFASIRLIGLVLAVLSFAPAVFAGDADDIAAAKQKKWAAIDTGAFADSIHHAVMKNKGQKAGYERYAPDRIVHIAENLLAYQNGDGGWPKNIDWLKPLSDEERAALPHGEPGTTWQDSTLDNSNTWSQIGYLAQVYRQTRLKRYADSALKAIDYVLKGQRPSGGWRGADVEAITFNDDAMAGVLRTLKSVIDDTQLYDFVDPARRASALKEYEKGIRCTLDCQIKVNGRLTAWCQQHDHETLKPIWARSFEPPSLTACESTDVVRMLMEIDKPSPEVIRAVQAAVAWLDKVKIPGLRIEKAPAEPIEYKYHYADFDYVEVKDPHAPPIWTRHYDLETETPIFCDRDRKITRNFADLQRERRTGTAWYGHWPEKLLAKEYPVWQKNWAPDDNVLKKENH